MSTGNLTVNATAALNLGQGNVGGTLDANSGGAITQTGALTLAGTTTLNAGTAAITLGQALNNLQGAITATGGAVSLRSAHDLNLFALTQPANRALVLEAGGTLFLPAGTGDIDTGTAALTLSSLGGAFSTFGTLKGGDVTVRGQSVALAHDVTASGSLDVQSAAGTISQTAGKLVVTGTSRFDAGTAAITLNQTANAFSGAVGLTGGTTSLVNSNALILDTSTITGNLVANSGGHAISQAGALSVTGTSSFNAGSAAITLTNSGNSWTGAVGMTGGATQLRSAGALALGSSTVSSLALTSGGAISQNAAINVTGA
ncbi:hypothetical protein ACG02S_26205, partial [Roseateles sp. DC23W]